MNITIVCPELQGTGGTETVLVNVISKLSSKYNIKLLLSNWPNDSNWLKRLPENVVVSYPKTDKKYGKFVFFLKNSILAKNDEIFIVLGANLVKFIAQIKKIFHKKYRIISWIHFSLLNQDMFNPQNLLYADEHIAISGQIKKQLISLGVEHEKVHLIYNPVKKAKLLPNRLNDDMTQIIYVGRILFNGQKNLKELFDAVAQVKGNIFIDIYGDGPDREKCEMYLKELSIDGCFKWHGWQKNVWDQIKERPDALILTSKYEGLPMVMLEAMARGIPCVTTEFEGYDDILSAGVNGFSYKLGEIDSLVEILDNLKEKKLDPFRIQNSISQCYEEQYYFNLFNFLEKNKN